MFSKNNLKYLLILALGFFWCSSVYLTQEQYLTNYASNNFRSIHEYNIEVTGDDKILTLSSCIGDGSKRVVLHAKLVDVIYNN